MNFRRVAIPRGNKKIYCLFVFGLAALTAMPAVLAEETVPAKPTALNAPSKPVANPPAKIHVPKPVGPAECVRTGQRVIAALARDDSGAASQFHTFYTAFKCPQQHLAQSFGCLVNLQTANPGLSNPTPEQVKQCWDNPSEIPKEAPPAPAQPATDATGEKK
ncbi:MAG: hypothetical protein PHE55_07695 [Methylococcaceae bacterium]|nr:hypothetical protein [Methylococcaceae bacterium]